MADPIIDAFRSELADLKVAVVNARYGRRGLFSHGYVPSSWLSGPKASGEPILSAPDVDEINSAPHRHTAEVIAATAFKHPHSIATRSEVVALCSELRRDLIEVENWEKHRSRDEKIWPQLAIVPGPYNPERLLNTFAYVARGAGVLDATITGDEHRFIGAFETLDRIEKSARRAQQKGSNEMPVPATHATGWKEICKVLGLETTGKEFDTLVKRLKGYHEEYPGPIVFREARQPIADQGELIAWYNSLIDKFRATEADRKSKSMTVANQYDFRESTVVPEISGSVKKRKRH